MMFFNQNAKYYEWLPAYLEGGLNEAQQAQMQRRLNTDFALALEAERQRRALESLRQWAALEETPANAVVPKDLWARLATRLEPEPMTQSVRQIRWTAGIGVAAVLTLAAALWLPIKPAPRSSGTVKIAKTTPHSPSVKTLDQSPLRPIGPPPLSVTITPTALPPNLGQSAATPTTVATTKLPPAVSTSTVTVAQPSNVAPIAPPSTPKPVEMATRRIAPSMEDTPASLDETVPVFSVPPATDSLPAADQTVGGRIKADSATFSNSKSPNSTPGGEGGSAVGKFSADRFAARGKDLLTLEAPREASTPVIRMAPTAAAPSPESSAGMTQSLRTADGKGLNDEQRIHWQSALSSSVQSPLWGNDSGADQTREALMAASKAGQLNILRDHLEEQCAQSPQDIGAGRMLAALYDFSGKSDLGLQERRRLSGLAATTGEDWFALAQAEERAGNIQAAKAAYRHALESPVPPNASHAARARQRE